MLFGKIGNWTTNKGYTNTNGKWIVGFTLLCVICAAIWLLCGGNVNVERIAQIKQGNTVIKIIDLSAVSQPYEFDVVNADNGYTKIRV